jgi:hypothetical protein
VCSSCSNRHPDGTHKNVYAKSQNRRRYRVILKNRLKMNSRMYGIKLFERITGLSVQGLYEKPSRGS